ncbi:hypothetical protein CLM68_26105, partial [Serratia marcescens]
MASFSSATITRSRSGPSRPRRSAKLPRSFQRCSLRLAQELGAETATLADPSEERAVLRYAREHNRGKIIIGRRSEPR